MKSKSRLILSFQFLLLFAYSVVLWATEPLAIFRGERGVGIVLLMLGVVILAAAVMAYRNAVGTFMVKPSPEPAERGGLITK
ncbi:MAG: hypothetical protein WBP29_09310, partial [Candidatus Zixiibacteriota bacterium]